MDNVNFSYACMRLAMKAHANQKRAYTNEPYIGHLAEVAGIVATVSDFGALSPDLLISVAWLHDIIEDQGYTPEMLWKALYEDYQEQFSVSLVERTVRGIGWLTSPKSDAPRTERKLANAVRLGQAPHWVQTIKCADIISNSKSVLLHAPDFAPVYLREKKTELEHMTLPNKRLHSIAMEIVINQLATA